MPAQSQVQQQAAGAALAAKEGKKPARGLYGASKGMFNSMSAEQLRHFAKTKTSGLPHAKACASMEDEARDIVNNLLAEDGGEEQAEVSAGQTILRALRRLQSSLPNASPEQAQDLTVIRAAASSLVRLHSF